MKCTPIFVPLAITRGSYLGYCKQILWPAFHNVGLFVLTLSAFTYMVGCMSYHSGTDVRSFLYFDGGYFYLVLLFYFSLVTSDVIQTTNAARGM